ncbi:PTS sugar transporter subunit IIC [Enterococcus lactis]|uniref:PTS sugar transporter subunit IIC n=1 Tax=Enterococcus lactis TaxID=357441 RepID=UPI003770607B
MNLQTVQAKYQPIVTKISSNRYLKAIMNGMMAALPATIAGSLAALIKQLPIPVYQEFLNKSGLADIIQLPITFTTNFLAILFVFSITYSLVESFDKKGLTAAMLSVVAFMIITPVEPAKSAFGLAFNIPMTWLGAAGMFAAIIVAVIVGRLFIWITDKGWTIKMPDSVPPFIKESFATLVPGFIIIGIFTVIAGIFASTPFGSFHQMIYTLLQIPLQGLGGNIWALLFVSLISQVFWFFGIHGTMVVLSVMMPIWMAMDATQLNAYSAGEALPNIVGFMFFTVYTYGGTVLGLALLMLFAKSTRYKTLGKLSIVPAFFGITEPLIFGTPLVFNPIFAIPFIGGSVLSLVVGYLATLVGILPRLSGISTPVGTPIIVQGLMAGGWKIAIFQVVLIAFWVVLWYPFFKIADKQALDQEMEH